MPNFTGYIERDPVKRPHIYQWTSDFAYSTNLQAEAGYGYFLKRKQTTIDFTLPSTPYDGDVVAIIDITKDNELAAAENTYINLHHPGTVVIYNGIRYEENAVFYLDYLQHYQQYFLYIQSINTWIGSYIRLDATISETVVQQTYGIIYYGECATNGNYAAKVVSVDNTFVQAIGANLRIVFTNENTAENPTLNVNEWGAIPIKYTRSKPAPPGLWEAGQAVDLVFDGYSWLIVDTANAGGGSGSGGLTTSEVNDLISVYLAQNGITGVSDAKIRSFIVAYLEENGAQAGISEAECVAIIEQYLQTHNIQGSVNEAQVNALIAKYIRDNNIGSGGSGSGGGLTTSQVNTLIEEYYNAHKESGKGITFCRCSTSDSTADKIANISDGSTFELKTGASVRVFFSYAQKAADPRLNVANTGAKAIRTFGQNAAQADQWKAEEVIDFVYDGSVWYIVDGARKQDAIDFVSSSDAIQNAVNVALQGNIEAMIDNKTATTIAALNAQVDAKIEAMEGSVASSIETLRGQVNTTIEGFRTEVGQTRTQLEQNIQAAITAMQGQIADEVADINAGINETISTAFDAAIDEKIQANFTNVVQQQINTATSNLEASITQLRTDLTSNVNLQIESMTSTINTKIAEFESQFANETRQLRDSIATTIATQFTETINQRIDDAFNATIDAKITAAFEGAEGTLNTAIASYQQSINQQFAEIRSSVGDDIRTMREYMEGQLTAFQAQIETTISDTFDNAIDEKIQQNLTTHIHQIIQSEFITSINSLINDKVDELDAKIQADIKKAVDDFNAKVKTFTDTIDQRIATHYTQHIEQDIGALRTQLRNEITAAVNSLEGTIDQKLENKFNSTIDTLMENKFSAMIDTKIEQGFDTRVTAKVNEAKAEIMNNIDARIDAKIRTAIDGEITQLINTKLEDYIAPAIGALY